MGEKRYLIKEAAKLVEVEPHVLRYWEEELDIKIKRNDMGHRYYDEQDIKILQKVKELKDRGIQLKAIHELVKKMYEILEQNEHQAAKKEAASDGQAEDEENDGQATGEKSDRSDGSDRSDRSEEDALSSFDFTKELVEEATQIANVKTTDGRVVDFKLAQFQTMMTKIISNSMKESIKPLSQAITTNTVDEVVKQMDVLLKEQEDREEARYKKLDATLREMQQARREIAAAEMKRKKKFGFKKKK